MNTPDDTSGQPHLSTQPSSPAPTQADTPIQASEPTGAPTPMRLRPAKRLPELTPKQAKFVTAIVDEGMSKTEAYIQAYDHTGLRKTAHEEASRTARLPQVSLQLSKYSGIAESTIVEIMNYSSEYGREQSGSREQGSAYASVALSAAKDVLDRVHGKATQRVEATTKAVNINIDLTGVS